MDIKDYKLPSQFSFNHKNAKNAKKEDMSEISKDEDFYLNQLVDNNKIKEEENLEDIKENKFRAIFDDNENENNDFISENDSNLIDLYTEEIENYNNEVFIEKIDDINNLFQQLSISDEYNHNYDDDDKFNELPDYK